MQNGCKGIGMFIRRKFQHRSVKSESKQLKGWGNRPILHEQRWEKKGAEKRGLGRKEIELRKRQKTNKPMPGSEARKEGGADVKNPARQA